VAVGDLREDRLRCSDRDRETSAEPTQTCVECQEVLEKEVASQGACAVEDASVENEDALNRIVVEGGVRPRRIVAQPQVSPKPDEGAHATGTPEFAVVGTSRSSSSAPVTMRGGVFPNMKRWKGSNAYE
jgi:hypothetical protein